jgi:hypothetical protein
MRFRIFGTNHVQPEPAALLEFVRGLEFGYEAQGRFSTDESGWFRAELKVEEGTAPLIIDRYLAREDDIRAELNAWAAWLETAEYNPNHGWLMQHIIRTTQLFTLGGAMDADSVLPVERVYLELCRYLAAVTEGVYQVDGHGFYSADSVLLLNEAEAP